jgi:hypothetical protein
MRNLRLQVKKRGSICLLKGGQFEAGAEAGGTEAGAAAGL